MVGLIAVIIMVLFLCTTGSLQELAVAGSCGSEHSMAALLTAACKSRHLHLLDVRGLQLAGKVGPVCQWGVCASSESWYGNICTSAGKHCQPTLACEPYSLV